MTISRIFFPVLPSRNPVTALVFLAYIRVKFLFLVFFALHLSPPWGSVMRAASHLVGRTRFFLAWNVVTNTASYAKRGNIFKLHISP